MINLLSMVDGLRFNTDNAKSLDLYRKRRTFRRHRVDECGRRSEHSFTKSE